VTYLGVMHPHIRELADAFQSAQDRYHEVRTLSAACHPEGTQARIAADIRERRASRAARDALIEAHRAYLLGLRACGALHPTDENIRDLLRVWAALTPRWSPGGASLAEREMAAHGGRFATEVARKDAALASWRVWCDSSPRG